MREILGTAQPMVHHGPPLARFWSSTSLLTRRTALRTLLSILPLAFLGTRAATDESAPSTRHLVARLRALMSDPAPAAAIGRSYLDQHSASARTPRQLVERILGHWSPADLERVFRDERFLRKKLNEQQRQDFQQDEVVNFHGWILSRTELDLCGLIAATS